MVVLQNVQYSLQLIILTFAEAFIGLLPLAMEIEEWSFCGDQITYWKAGLLHWDTSKSLP